MEIRWMKYKNENGEKENFYPVTHAKAIVYDEDDEKTIEEIHDVLQEVLVQYSNLQTVVEIPLLSSNWSSSYPYTQTISHSSIKESSSPTLIKILTGSETEDEVKAYEKAYGLIFFGETTDGSVTIYAKSLPEIDFVIGLKGV